MTVRSREVCSSRACSRAASFPRSELEIAKRVSDQGITSVEGTTPNPLQAGARWPEAVDSLAPDRS